MSKAFVRAMVAIQNPSEELAKHIKKTLCYMNPAYVRQVRFGSVYAAKVEKFLHAYIEEADKGIIWVPRAWFYANIYGSESLDITQDTVEKPAEFPAPLLSPLPQQLDALTNIVNQINTNDGIGKPTDTYVVLPPGGGKTILGMLLMVACRQKSLVILPTREIEETWLNDAKKVFGKEAHSYIGHIRGKTIKTDRIITLGSVQTIMDLPPHLWSAEFGLVLFDELHRFGAEMFSNAIKRCRAHIRVGLTATDARKDGRFTAVRWHLGDSCFRTTERVNTVPLIYSSVITMHGLTRDKVEDFTFNDLIEDLQNNANRTAGIAWLASHILDNYKGDILIVSPRTEHLTEIARQIEMLGINSFCIITGKTPKRKQLFADVCAGVYRITIATTSIMSEGASNPRWHHVINTLPFSDPKTAVQLSGRAIRKAEHKDFGMFWDIIDSNPMCRAMYRTRWNTLKKFLKETRVARLRSSPPFALISESKARL